MLKVAVCSADPERCRDLAERLGEQAGIVLIGGAEGRDALARLLDEVEVDAVVADWDLLDGSMTDLLAGTQCPTIALLASDDGAGDALEALHAGVHSVLPGNATGAEIAAAAVAVARGWSLLPREALERLLEAPGLAPPLADAKPGHPPLTPREIEVLAAMADGASNKAIARRLSLSFHTVKFHVAAILAKLDADSRTEAVARAARLGLIML